MAKTKKTKAVRKEESPPVRMKSTRSTRSTKSNGSARNGKPRKLNNGAAGMSQLRNSAHSLVNGTGDSDRRLAQIRLISMVSSRISADLEREELLAVAARGIQETFNYFDVTVFLIENDPGMLELVAHAGSYTDFLPHGYRQEVGKGMVGWVARHGESLVSNDVSTERRYHSYEYHDTKSEIAIPIRIDGRVIGVLNVEERKTDAFDAIDTIVLTVLADQIGAAVKNARLYDEIKRANMQLVELDTMKSEFLGIVSHDFRAPLSSIMLAARAMLKNEAIQAMPRVRDYMQMIVDQSVRLNQLAEDTLSITRLESGRLNFFFRIVNMERLIQDAISMVRLSRAHELEYHVDPDAIFIRGDQTKLRQVVQNLVSNAVKYSPSGGKVSVRVTNHSAEDVLVSVSDQGVGVPQAKLGRLFKKFSRIDNDQTREIKGAGLGLWICREIVEGHDGEIWMESEHGKGSTVKFRLSRSPGGS